MSASAALFWHGNERCGLQVRTLEDIEEAAKRKRSLISRHHQTPIPAAIVLRMQGHAILQWIKGGLYEYIKQEGCPWPQMPLNK